MNVMAKQISDEKIEEFNVEEYLENNGIDYKNSSNNILINCQYCNDTKFKAGILKTSKVFNCFKCNTKGGIVKLISKISGCSYKQAKEIIINGIPKNFQEIGNIEKEIEDIFSENENEEMTEKTVKLPPSIALKNLIGVFKRMFHGYLQNRMFPIEYLEKFNISACISGYYKNRLIIPIYHKKKLVTFLTRDVTEREDAKYKNLPANQSILTVKETLFGYDQCVYGDKIILVEGSFDWLRVYQAVGNIEGVSVLAVLGKSVTIQQQLIIQRLNPKSVIILFDSGTESDSYKLKMELSPFVDDVSIINSMPKDKDPADLSCREIINILGLKNDI